MGDDKCTSEVEVKTPVGSFSSKGKHNAELIAAIAMAVMSLQLYLVYTHVEDAKSSSVALASALREFAGSQRELACMLRFPQDQREWAYKECTRIGSM